MLSRRWLALSLWDAEEVLIDQGNAMAVAESIIEEGPISDYLQRLELGADPFASSGDYFYAGADRRNSLDQIVHFCRFSEQLVVLTAEQGNGKTTLVDATVAQLHSVIDCCRIPATDISNSESIVSTFGRALKLPVESPSIKSFLASLHDRTVVDKESEPVLIIVEQAESLPLAHIENLVKLHELARSSMHLMLVGTLPLKRRIEKIAAENPYIKLFTLQPLSLSDLEAYILGSLQSAGYNGSQPLSQDQLIVLHEQSGGNIAAVNRLIPVLLDDTDKKSVTVRAESLPRGHLLALGVLVLALAGGLVYEWQSRAPAIEGSVSRTSTELPVSLPVAGEQKSAPVREVSQPSPSRAQPDSSSLAVVDASESRSIAKAGREAGTVPATARPAPKPATPAPTPKVNPVVAVAPAIVDNKPQATPKPKPAPTRIDEKQVKPKPGPAATVAAGGAALSARDQRLLGLDANGFMLQILGSSSEQGVRDYVKQYVGRLPVSYFETRMRQKPWFVVLAGPYGNREQARQAVEGFPEEVKKQLPWVRSVASIQADIRARTEP